MIYKHEIVPFNEFWLDCDTQMLFSILISVDKKYLPLTYRNDYEYILLNANTKSGRPFYELRVLPDIFDLRNALFEYKEQCKIKDITRNINRIKEYLIQGFMVLVGVDLYEWIEKNMCYHNHHVEHYAFLNGYDDIKNVFYTMETDNESYKEFEIKEEQLVEAMSLMCTLKYSFIAFSVNPKLELEELYQTSILKKNAKCIYKSIKPLLKNQYWIFEPEDYKTLFYRDMTVMYLMQINCRAKANRLLFEYLYNEKGLDREYAIIADELEKGWIDVRRSISKLYFKEDAIARMREQNVLINSLLIKEQRLWKQFVKENF